MLQASLSGSPAGVPGSRREALGLRVALGTGVVQALGRRESTQPRAVDQRGGERGPPSRGCPAAASPAPGGPQAGRALRWGQAGSASCTRSGGYREGAGRHARPGTLRPGPPGSPRSAGRWAGGSRRTPGPPLGGGGGARGCDLGQEALPAPHPPRPDPRQVCWGNVRPTPSPVPLAQHPPTLGAPTAMPTAPHTVTHGHGPPACWPPHQERGSPSPDRAPSQASDVTPYRGGPCRIQARVRRGRRRGRQRGRQGRSPFCLQPTLPCPSVTLCSR